MRDAGLDLFDPRTAVIDSDCNLSPSNGSEQEDFAFAFNDSNFSDRVLRIEIMPDSPDTRPDSEGCLTLADWATRKSKRRRGDIGEKENALDINIHPEEQTLDCPQPDIEICVDDDNHDEEEIQMIEELSPGDEAANSDDSNWSEDNSRVLRVRTLHISSPILAAKSPFFFKLFSNGMMESEQRHVTLRITASEEAALMELLNFMYSNTLTTTTAPALLDVLMAADKFQVASCMRYCSRLLRNMPMTPESALLYLDLPTSVLMADAVQPLTDAAKQFLAARFKDISKYQEEILSLPLAGIEAILSSDDLQVASEDAVYDFALKWTRSHCQKLEERREILGTHLGQYIRFPYMTPRKLKKVLTCNDFDHEFATKVVLEALFFKTEPPHRQRLHSLEDLTSTNHRYVERAYKYRPIKVVEFELPHQQCVVFLDLKREECANLFPSGRVYSQAFHLGGQGFSCQGIAIWINKALFIVLVCSSGCKKRVLLHSSLTMNSLPDQNPQRSSLANTRAITLSLGARQLDIAIYLAFRGRLSWLTTVSTSSTAYSTSGLSLLSGARASIVVYNMSRDYHIFRVKPDAFCAV